MERKLNKNRRILLTIFDKLFAHYGPRKWWPAKTRFEVIAGAILAQNVTWKNAETAVISLKQAGLLNPFSIVSAKHAEITSKIKSSRYYNQKTEKLKGFCSYLIDNYDGSLNKLFSRDMEELRKELLSLKGIGKETADSILLYAGKKISFVCDAYTKRFLARYGILNDTVEYDEIREFFMINLPRDIYLYNEYHALIVHHGYLTCKTKPECRLCPVRKISRNLFCKWGQRPFY